LPLLGDWDLGLGGDLAQQPDEAFDGEVRVGEQSIEDFRGKDETVGNDELSPLTFEDRLARCAFPNAKARRTEGLYAFRSRDGQVRHAAPPSKAETYIGRDATTIRVVRTVFGCQVCPHGSMTPRGSGARTKFQPRTVLVVDDHDDNRELFATVLRGEGLVVITARDGVDGLEVAARERPDVVLMDLAMPIMDGFDAIERLRREEHGRSMLIIVASAFADRASRQRAMEVGADAFLAKPCSPRDLIALVNELTSGDPPKAAAG
jgi:two-component system, cell cycle response regulator DivK